MRRSAIALVLLAGLVTGCASTGSSGTENAATASSGNSNRISGEEIAAVNLPTAYDVVERLRRPWLRRSANGADVVVYMDERNIGETSELRSHPSATVAELQYVTYEQAVRRWGSSIQGAVIVLVPRR